MIVCIDIGNTATKMTTVADEVVHARVTFPTRDVGGPARLQKELTALIRESGEQPARFAIASVVTAVTPGVCDAISGRWDAPIVTVDYLSNLGFTLAVTIPGRVGVDRLCAAAGAISGERRDAVVVDVGSAITVDRVRDREFIGGAIMPGPGLMFDALAAHTSDLPAIDVRSLDGLFPESPEPTEQAMALGVGSACLGGIRQAVEHLGDPDRGVPVVITGGFVSLISTMIPLDWIQDPDLVARGLYRIALLNISS